jgi:flagellar L-ring protein precursor FlgH
MNRTIALIAVLCLAPAHAADAQGNDSYDQQFQHYLETARQVSATPATPWMGSLFTGLRARNVNDLVTINVVERIAASGKADSSLNKNSNASGSLGSIFGINPKFADWFDPTALAKFQASSDFKGGGATTRNGELSAVITARVSEVLPNGDLVLEGVREVDINGDKQMVVKTGVVRPSDIGPGNVVPSTAVGQMRIKYYGNGLIKDNLSPGWLVRIFNKVF